MPSNSGASLEDRQATEDAFYSSDVWRKGPRQSIIEHIETCQDTLIWLTPEAVEPLRHCWLSASLRLHRLPSPAAPMTKPR